MDAKPIDIPVDSQKKKKKRKKKPAAVETTYEQELDWCIKQIEAGVKNNQVTSDQAKDSLSALKTLTDPEEPLVKKRQLMFIIFGDYRKLMKDPKYKLA